MKSPNRIAGMLLGVLVAASSCRSSATDHDSNENPAQKSAGASTEAGRASSETEVRSTGAKDSQVPQLPLEGVGPRVAATAAWDGAEEHLCRKARVIVQNDSATSVFYYGPAVVFVKTQVCKGDEWFDAWPYNPMCGNGWGWLEIPAGTSLQIRWLAFSSQMEGADQVRFGVPLSPSKLPHAPWQMVWTEPLKVGGC